jgi:hypothetical protein
MRRSALASITVVTMLAVPSVAFAADGASDPASWGIGVVALVAAIGLLTSGR